MAAVKAVVYDGGLQRQALPGDVLAQGEVIITINNNAGQVLPAASMLSGIINRTGAPGAGYIDTTDSAAAIIAAMIANYPYLAPNTGLSGGAAVPNGTTVRLKVINNIAFANTVAAGANVTIVTATINASSVKEYLLQVTCGQPQQIIPVNQVNATAVLTGMSQFQTSQLAVGMAASGTNIAASTIISIQPGVGVTLSANVTATLANNPVTFNPTVTLTGLGQGLL